MRDIKSKQHDAAALIERFAALDARGRYELGDQLYAMGEAAVPALWQAVQKDIQVRRFALSTLARMARKLPPEPTRLDHLSILVEDTDDKVRKHAAVLLGAMGPAAVPALKKALNSEGFPYVRVSLILSLGTVGGEDALSVLNRYTAHTPEEEEALRLALDKLTPRQTHTLSHRLPMPIEVELLTVPGCARLITADLKQMGIASRVLPDGRIRADVRTLDFTSLRPVTMWLLPGARVPDTAPQAAADAAVKSELLARIRALHGDLSGQFRYRVQVNLPTSDRAAWIRTFAKQLNLQDAGFVDSPSGYEMQFLITPAQSGCRIDARLHTYADTRFSYRKQDVPASINPATAAGLFRLAQAHLSPTAHAIDPFCGSGTLLVERARTLPCAQLTGVDIATRAIAAARENVQEAGLSARIVRGDARNFRLTQPADELFANLPFGNRVGNHAGNEELYRAFFKNLPNMLKPGGLLMLYTMEQQLTRPLLAGFERIDEVCVPSGGLKPMLFLARRR